MESPQLQRSRYTRSQFEREQHAYSPRRQENHHRSSAYYSPPPESHSSTPPIVVPQHKRQNAGNDSFGNECGSFRGSDMFSHMSGVGSKPRSAGVSWAPQMKSETGQNFPLGSPLPKPVPVPAQPGVSAEKIARESDFGGLGDTSPQPFHRSNSSSSLFNPTSFRRSSRSGSVRRRPSAASRFLAAAGSPIAASLTSDSTLSPPEELNTPSPSSQNGEYFTTRNSSSYTNDPVFSPRTISSADSWTTSPPKSSFFPASFSLTRSRSTSRSTRSASLSAGASPASMFLNSINTAPAASADPTAEGFIVRDKFVIGKQLGFGGFSVVKEAISLEEPAKKLAVKIVSKTASASDVDNDKVQEDFTREVEIWRKLFHPHILPLEEIDDSPDATYAFMPLVAGGTLFDTLKTHRSGLPLADARRYAFQLAHALRYMHSLHLVHGDVKLENCLLDDAGNLLLCDFGLTHHLDDCGSPAPAARPPTPPDDAAPGSLPYAAPELLAARQTPGKEADVWAFGVTLYALLTGSLPFRHAFAPRLLQMIVAAEWDPQELRACEALSGLDAGSREKVVELVAGCLQPCAERRWDLEAVVESPWFQGCVLASGVF